MTNPIAGRHPAFDLFIVSWLILFLELALIRWLAAHVLFLSFFTNTILLASFVGMSIGCLLARRQTDLIARTPLWLAVTLGTGLLTQSLSDKLTRYVGVGNQASPDEVFFGAESSTAHVVEFAVPVELFQGAFFVLAALALVGPGQELGRAFNRIPGRNRAYGWNLLGSLAGIGSFAACSYAQLPPLVWFGLAAVGLLYLLPVRGRSSDRRAQYLFLVVALLAVVRTSGLVEIPGQAVKVAWSPYYRVDYGPQQRTIGTNQLTHQVMQTRDRLALEPYPLPYVLRRELVGPTGAPLWPEFRRVLIIGSGSGNDLSRATQWGPPDARIDAVEIDPVILSLGRAHHPDQPYQDPRVTAHLNDGRNFLRSAPDGEYDLVVFALVDSLVLHTGYSSLRLESFLMTAESFRDVRRVLKPTGVAVVYNWFRQGWVATRLRDQIRAEFGAEPVTLTDPPVDLLRTDQFDEALFTTFLAGSEGVIAPLREQFERSGNNFWLPRNRPAAPETPATFSPTEPPPIRNESAADEARYGWAQSGWARLRSTAVQESEADLPPATDDWPFLYTRRAAIPDLTLRGVAIVVFLALGLWLLLNRWTAVPAASRGPSTGQTPLPPDRGLAVRAFFLGAGFMLIETKAVVQMALLFGSTWVVNTVVFAAILIMALAGNLVAGWLKPRHLGPYYIGLFTALGLNLAIPLNSFLGLDRTIQILGSCLLVFAPVAFAGVVFAGSFGRASRPDRVFGANIAGALAGGLAENLSLVVGFHWLVLVAAGCYLASGLLPATGTVQRESSDAPPQEAQTADARL